MSAFIPTPTDIGNVAFFLSLLGSTSFALFLAWKLIDWAMDRILAHAIAKEKREADEAFYKACLRAAGEPSRVWPPTRSAHVQHGRAWW